MMQDPAEETIRAYLIGKLSEPERKAFEADMEQDASLVQQVAQLRAEMAASEYLIAEETRELFAQWGKGKPQKNKNNILGWTFWVIGGLVVVLAIWFYQSRQTTPVLPTPHPVPVLPEAKEDNQPVAAQEKQDAEPPVQRPAERNYLALARQHYREPALSAVRRSQTDTTTSPMALARQAYVSGNYDQALVLLEKVDSTRRQSADFLAANALFHLGKYREAETTFQSLVSSGSKQYRYPSEWSLLICRLAQLPARKADFDQQLRNLLNQPDHPYYQPAKDLDKSLKNR